MTEFVMSKRISDEINIHASENNTPFLSFEFFPPKTEVLMLFPDFFIYSFLFPSLSL
jgi:5,10-methylenetetrahydrofolate reductase